MSLDVELYKNVDLGGTEEYRLVVYEYNITHNLGAMADEAGLYMTLWRPEEVNCILASDLIPNLEKGLGLLVSDPDRFTPFNNKDNWGTYDQLVEFVQDYLNHCKKFPKANVSVSR